MLVRCKINDSYIFPDSQSPADLSTFWGVIAGYSAKKKSYEIEWGFKNNDNVVFYEGDPVEVEGDDGEEVELTIVFNNGSFIGENDEGLEVELSTL